MACPASWNAIVLRSSFEMILPFFSIPPMTRSIAASKSSIVTASAARRAPTMAASLQTFAMSAPLIPGESAASRCAYFCTERVDVSSCVARGRIDEQTKK